MLPERVAILGIRHHGPGSAALTRQALDALDPACVLIEGPPEADDLIAFAGNPGMKPPLALLLHAEDDANAAIFAPFAEFSPEWQALRWAGEHQRPARFIDWPAGAALAWSRRKPPSPEAAEAGAPEARAEEERPRRRDPLEMLAEAAGYADGEAFWNALIEQNGGTGQQAMPIFAAVEAAMTEARAAEYESGAVASDEAAREARREAYMRQQIRQALKDHDGPLAVIVGAWHAGALRAEVKAADDRALLKDLPKLKVTASWVPWTDSRLSLFSGYGAGVVSPGWYRHLWSLYAGTGTPAPAQFAAIWQAKTAQSLRLEGHLVPTASAIEAARLALGLAALRELGVPGLAEMRDASLAALCHGDATLLGLIERKLYVGETVGELGEDVPQTALARDLALWQKRTRLKPSDLDTDIRLDLRSEAGLLKSTLLHRLALIGVHWGRLVEAGAGRGTFREDWRLRWVPELSVALAEALIHGVTIEQASGNATLDKARRSASISELAGLVEAALVADLPDTAIACIGHLQAAAVQASDITELMRAATPLMRILRYGTARKLPEEALRALITALGAEINAGVRTGSQQLDEEATRLRLASMRAFDEALGQFDDEALLQGWRRELAHMVDDDQVSDAVAGLSLRRLHDLQIWDMPEVASAFSRHIGGQPPQKAGAFLESFLAGGSEVMLHDHLLLQLVDGWLCELDEEAFIESLPLLRRSFSSFDMVSRRRLLERLAKGRQESSQESSRQGLAAGPIAGSAEDTAFAAALPLLARILGLGPAP